MLTKKGKFKVNTKKDNEVDRALSTFMTLISKSILNGLLALSFCQPKWPRPFLFTFMSTPPVDLDDPKYLWTFILFPKKTKKIFIFNWLLVFKLMANKWVTLHFWRFCDESFILKFRKKKYDMRRGLFVLFKLQINRETKI